MTLNEIKTAIAEGKSVKWSNSLYDVVLGKSGEYLIICHRGHMSENVIGLTWRDNVTLNGDETDFYIAVP